MPGSRSGSFQKSFIFAAITVLVLLAGCDCFTGQRSTTRMVVVLVDISSSIQDKDWGLYKEAYDSAVGALEQGDRLVLGPLGEGSLTDFTAVAEEVLPNTGKQEDDTKGAQEKKKKLAERFGAIGKLPRSRTTPIFESLTLAAKLFDERKREHSLRRLVILSDMVESTKALDMRTSQVNSALYDRIMAERKKNEAIPDLNGVETFVVGASGLDEQRFLDIQKFWLRYLTAASASADTSRYGRSVPMFAKSDAICP